MHIEHTTQQLLYGFLLHDNLIYSYFKYKNMFFNLKKNLVNIAIV